MFLPPTNQVPKEKKENPLYSAFIVEDHDFQYRIAIAAVIGVDDTILEEKSPENPLKKHPEYYIHTVLKARKDVLNEIKKLKNNSEGKSEGDNGVVGVAVERFSQLPVSFFHSIVKYFVMDTSYYNLSFYPMFYKLFSDIDKCHYPIEDAKAATERGMANQTSSPITLRLSRIDEVEMLRNSLPDSLLGTFFSINEENTVGKVSMTYDEIRQHCYHTLIKPLACELAQVITSSSRRSPPSDILSDTLDIHHSYQRHIELVVSDDVFHAYDTTVKKHQNQLTNKKRRTSAAVLSHSPLNPIVYGYGVMGHQRTLLSHGILSVLKKVAGSDDVTIDPIALSVLHDMIVSKAIEWIQQALLMARIVPLGEKSCVWCNDGGRIYYEKQVIDVDNDAFSVPVDENYDVNLKRTWNPTVIVTNSHYDDPIDKRYSASEEHIRIIDLDVLQSTCGRIVGGNDMRLYINAEMIKASTILSMKHDTVISAITNTGSIEGFVCNLSPILVLFLLQHHPMLSMTNSFYMSDIGLIALTAGLEAMLIDLLENAIIQCRDEKQNASMMRIHTSHINKAIQSDDILLGTFPGIIRDDDEGVSMSQQESMRDLIKYGWLYYICKDTMFSTEAISLFNCIVNDYFNSLSVSCGIKNDTAN